MAKYQKYMNIKIQVFGESRFLRLGLFLVKIFSSIRKVAYETDKFWMKYSKVWMVSKIIDRN
jgi:hypothetical protein